MKWNVENIVFIHAPDIFKGEFDNTMMQARHEQQVREKIGAIQDEMGRETDPLKALNILHDHDRMQFLWNNFAIFQEAGQLERAALLLYSRENSPFSAGGEIAEWNSLFQVCDAQLLNAAGTAVTFSSATVYRGSVSGYTKSLCWTPERKKAEWFAKRWEDPALGGGELYEVDIIARDVMVYRTDLREEQILLFPEFIESAEIRRFGD